MLTLKTLIYYDWDDIEKQLCEYMNIEPKYFRNYHQVVGGEYKDFWHVWIKLVYDDVRNDSYISMHIEMFKDREDMFDRFGNWIQTFLDAINKLFEELNTEEIVIHYCW